MNKDEIYEEIRALLREPQVGTVENPWRYDDYDLEIMCKSALRNLRIKGIPVTSAFTHEGELEPIPSETEGVLIALFVASRLLTGDLTQKLMDGELGIYFKAGPDVIDTQTVARHFHTVADKYDREFRTMLTVALTNLDGGDANVYGKPTPYNRDSGTEVV